MEHNRPQSQSSGREGRVVRQHCPGALKQEDAQALVDALKKKQYPAFTSNNSSTDKLFHVQIGPYSDIKDAEGMRAKLISDGYNPILKK